MEHIVVIVHIVLVVEDVITIVLAIMQTVDIVIHIMGGYVQFVISVIGVV